MKYILITILVLFGFLSTYAQKDTLTIDLNITEEVITLDSLPNIPFVAYWEVGDSYNFNVTKVKKRWKEGALVKNDSSSYISTFTVLDSTDTNYRIKWSFENDLSGFQLPDTVLNQLAAYNVSEIIYQTTELGEFITIENWEEVAKAMKSMLAIVVEGVVAEGQVSKAEIEKTLKPMMDILQTKEGIESMVLKELQQFHFPFGVEFSPVDTVFYEDKLPNMTGGDPIRSNVALYISDVDYKTSVCVLEEHRSLNKEDTKKFLLDILKKMGIEKEEDLDKTMEESKFDVEDTNSYAYFYFPGVPLKITCLRETNMEIAGESQISTELTQIELQLR